MLTVAIPKRNKLQNIIVLTPKDGFFKPPQGRQKLQALRLDGFSPPSSY